VSDRSGFGLSLSVDGAANPDLALAFQGRLEAVIEERKRVVERGFHAAAVVVEKAYLGELRADILAGGFANGDRLSKTWRGAVYPRSTPTLEPALFFKNKAATIIDAFASGVTITVHGAEYLAIPEGPAKAIVRRLNQAKNRSRNDFGAFVAEDNPVARVAQALGTTLVPLIDAARGQGVLVAANSTVLTPTGRMAKRQAGAPTVLFVLVKQATLKKRIQGRALIERLKGRFAGDFASAVATTLPVEGE
jgi:hypothetical protein